MSTLVRLVEVVVAHDYFTAAAPCRFDFLPDVATAAWLRRSGCLLRARDDRLSVYGDPVAARAAAATLTFAARPRDPDFDRYTARADVAAGSAPLLVFDTRLAIAARADGSFDLDAACPVVRDAAAIEPGVGAGFVIMIATDGPPGAVFHIALRSRSVRWKYLLAGDWGTDSPVVAGGGFTRQIDTALANGVPAVVLRSDDPISLGDRQGRELRSHDEHGPILIRMLPLPEPANIVREDPADPASLVAEIYVSR